MVDLSKLEYKDVGDAVGMPDKTDKQNIRRIILNYEKKNPGQIKQLRDYAREHSSAANNKFGLIEGNKGSVRYIMELPPVLHAKIEAYIPTIFRNKKHFAWFCKNFKELIIPEAH